MFQTGGKRVSYNPQASLNIEDCMAEEISTNSTRPDTIQEPGRSTQPQPRGDFTIGPVHRHLTRLTGYMFMGLVSVMTASLMEAVYVGIVGTNQLAAISFTFPLIMVLQGVVMGFSIGASSVVARTMGAGNRERVRRLITHCFLLVMTLTLLLTGAIYLYVGPIIKLLGAQPHILTLVVDYMHIWLLGFPFFTVALVGSMLMRATGDAATPGYLMAIGSGLHVVIAPFFIFGWGPAPELGLEGAAVGFALARTVSFCLYSYYIGYRDRLMIMNLTGLFSSCRDILKVGLPAIASNLISPVSMGITTRLLARHGTEVVAGFGVATRVDAMVIMIIISLSMSVAPFVGQNWGAGHYRRVKEVLKLSNRFSLLWGLFAFTLMVLFAEILVSFINDDPKVVTAAVTYLIIIPLSIGFVGFTMTATQSFNALGKPLPALVISINQMLVVYVPLAFLGDYLWGYTGIYIAFTLTNILVGVLSWYWINSLVEHAGPDK